MRVGVSVNDDYAGLNLPDLQMRFYYGYEVTTPANDEWDNAEWCFKYDGPGLSITIPKSQLGLSDRAGCAELLLAGIGQALVRMAERGVR